MLNDFFKLKEHNSDIKTEVIAGITTFIAMAYILGANPNMLAETGMSSQSVFLATALASGIACIIMGLISNYPIGLAPGIGLNALFTNTVVLSMNYSWKAAMAAVFISSVIFFVITVSGLRKVIINAIPADLKLAIGSGIGFFLAFIGLKNAGIIVANPNTLVCMGEVLNAPTLLGIIGIFITLILYVKIRNIGIFIGLIITALTGLIFTSAGYGTGLVTMPSIPDNFISYSFDTSVFFAFTEGFTEKFSNITNMIIIVFSFVFVNFFDTTGTLIPLAKKCGLEKEDGSYDGINKAFLSDSIGALIGVVCGTNTITSYVESSTGVSAGGRTGLTAITIGIMFLISIFFAPTILSLFTSSVTATALVFVGIQMIGQLKMIRWDNITATSSTFLTIIMMILTNSISLGIAWGFLAYMTTSLASKETEDISITTWLLAIIFILFIFQGL